SSCGRSRQPGGLCGGTGCRPCATASREKMGFLTARAPPSLTFFDDNYRSLAWRRVARKGPLCSDDPTYFRVGCLGDTQ
ncbi:unnamed protein product, partial [Ectocarpus fasciculatus]